MQPTGYDLECFTLLAAVGNMSRAAERLGVAQSTLSMLVRRLETYFGAPLVVRKKTGVDLTRAGQRLVSQSRTLQEEWRNLKATVLADEDEMTGLFSIGCHPSAAIYALPEAVNELLAAYPRIELRFQHDLSRRLTEDVVSHRLDFAMVSNPLPHPDLVVKKLYVDEVRAFQASTGEVRHDVLLCDPEMTETTALLESKALGALGFKRVVASRNLEYVYALTATGAGIGLFPAEVACVMGPDRVMLVPGVKLSYECRISLIYRVDTVRSRAAKALVRHFEERLADRKPLKELQERRKG